MRSTVADWNRLIIHDRARPYAIDPEERLANAPYVDNSYKWAGGGFLSTAEDLVRFGQAHLKPGFLKAETLSLLHTSQETSDDKATGYGIGWTLAQDQQGRRVIRHGGGSVGGTTHLAIYPQQGLVIAVITNLSSAPRLPVMSVVDAFLN